jgi:hypothetical protein
MTLQFAEQAGFFMGTLLGVFMVGAVCGLLPLIAGLCRKNRRSAATTWVLCVLIAILGWAVTSVPQVSFCITLPVAFVLMVVVLCQRSGPKSSERSSGKSTSPTGGSGCQGAEAKDWLVCAGLVVAGIIILPKIWTTG